MLASQPVVAQYVAHVDDVSDGAHPHPDVMETRSAPVGERDVVNAAFAMQPYRPDLIAAVDGRALRRAEPDFSEEVVRRLHVRRKAVDVIDPLDVGATIGAVLPEHRRHRLHLEEQLDRCANGIP